MSPAYRPAKNFGCMWILIVFAGIGVSIALGSQFNKSSGPWVIAVFASPILASIILAAILDNRITRRRQQNLADWLKDQGFHTELDASPESKEAFYGPLNHLTTWIGLQGGAANVQWLARKPLLGGSVCLFEHLYTTGSGKSTTIHPHTVIAWPAGVSDPPGAGIGNLAGLAITRPFLLAKRRLERQAQDIQIGDSEFDKDWVINGDPETARAFLTDLARHRLADSPKGESWQVGAGWVCCCYQGSLDDAGIRTFVNRSREVLALNRP